MAALVSRQLRGALEPELARGAGIRPLARVNALVELRLAEGEEGLLAVVAGERPLPRVDEIVSGERVRLGEALPTVGARVRTGAAVGDDVLLLRLLALEAFVTLRTRVGSLVHVGPVVLRELPLGQEALPALGAEERLLPRVHPLVSGQDGHQREPLGTVGALERPFARVNAEVFPQREAEGELFIALVTLVGTLPRVGGQVPLYVRPASKRLVALRALKLTLDAVHLPVLGACEQGVEAFATLLTYVALTGAVGLPVLQQLRGRGETLAANGANLREPSVLRVALLVVDGQRAEVGEGAPARLAGERDGHPVMLVLVLDQVPRVLEGAVTLRAAERSLPGVRELVSPDVRRAGERLAARFTRQGFPSAVRPSDVAGAVARALITRPLCVSSGEKLNRREYFISTGGRRCKFGSVFLCCHERPVDLRLNTLHVEVRRAVFV